MIKTNKDKLPIVSVAGAVWHPKGGAAGRITVDGGVIWLQGTGGITYNAQIGDPCIGWVADHLEPGVSTRHKDDEFNQAYTVLSCIGNEAIVRSGDAKGDKGIVTGKHGGCEHLMIHFPAETLEKLNIDDNIMVKASGQGMELLDYPEIKLRNTSPALLEKMNIQESAGKLKIGVAKIVPADIMGSGLGASSTTRGDYDITMFDDGMIEKYGLADLRFGDIVAVTNADNRYGRAYRAGACTIGVVIHGNSAIAGHGPGVTTLITTRLPLIEPFIDNTSNLANYFLNKEY
ncbi:MAG: DUF4438 domain-containing protein [Defluviitaleaceae bacterium]|nr:DUF4438 domain-containing protein [Defluviitaleaceae bacterium]